MCEQLNLTGRNLISTLPLLLCRKSKMYFIGSLNKIECGCLFHKLTYGSIILWVENMCRCPREQIYHALYDAKTSKD